MLKKKILHILQNQGAYPTRLLSSCDLCLDFIADHCEEEVNTTSLNQWWSDSDLCFEDRLRAFKNRVTLLIFYREVTEKDLMLCVQEFSNLADFCVQKTLQYCGIENSISVIGLGKLGGQELNYNSDIDIMFIAEKVDADLIKKVETIVSILDELREGGRVFRVDLRLRPNGSVGPLVQTLDPILKYYREWGREWERAMLIKARPISGNLELGQRFISMLASFVFRRSLDYRSINALKRMKMAIESEADFSQVFGLNNESTTPETSLSSRLNKRLKKKKTKKVEKLKTFTNIDKEVCLGWDTKIGRGGIREIEFFAQALQLVHGGRLDNVRSPKTIDALRRLFSAGLLAENDVIVLSDAYIFFRTIEHRVQMNEGQHTHRIPLTPTEFEVLASRLSLSPESLTKEINHHRHGVHERFSRLFSSTEKSIEKPTVDADLRWASLLVLGFNQVSPARAEAVFAKAGFRRPKDAVHQLSLLKSKKFGPFYEGSYLASYCLSCCAEAPEPSLSWMHLVRFFQTLGDRPGYYTMLSENPHATRLLIHIFSVSRDFSNALINDPNLFARLIGIGSIKVHRSYDEMSTELNERLDKIEDVDHRIGVIRRFKHEEQIRVALHYIGGVSHEDETFAQLSDLADIVVAKVLTEVYEPMRTTKREGLYLPAIEEIPFAIVALGKWGSKELSFTSDLDLMFVYENDRQYRLQHHFFAKLASRVMRQLGRQTAEGALYDVDARLRPSGSKGALVVSLDALKDYHVKGDLWERQALLKARALPSVLKDSFSALRKNIVFERVDQKSLHETKSYIVNMLSKIQKTNYRVGSRNPKYQGGGLVNVEFTVQFIQLALSIDGNAMNEIIEKIKLHPMRATILDEEYSLDELLKNYLLLRRVDAFLKISDRNKNMLPPAGPQLESLGRRVGLGDTFIHTYDQCIAALVNFCNAVLHDN